jgi:hypothetical protein
MFSECFSALKKRRDMFSEGSADHPVAADSSEAILLKPELAG